MSWVIASSVGFFAVSYYLWLLAKFKRNKHKILDRSQFEWLFDCGGLSLCDDDVDIEAVEFLGQDFDFRKELSLFGEA